MVGDDSQAENIATDFGRDWGSEWGERTLLETYRTVSGSENAQTIWFVGTMPASGRLFHYFFKLRLSVI